MKLIDVIQGTPEWLAARLGIPTASKFDQILTPGGKPSKSAEGYLRVLLAERIMGHPVTEFVSTWMDRGTQTEADAVAHYELNRDADTVKIGFCTNDAGTIGASPDRLVGEDGLLEVKCPSEKVHMGHLLDGTIADDHKPQVQGQLWIAERQWCDVLSYHPDLPPALIRVERDEEYIGKLTAAVEMFAAALEDATGQARARGWLK